MNALKPIEAAGKNKEHRLLWKYECQKCGNMIVWAKCRVDANTKVDCGCGKFERFSNGSKTHGMRYTKEYATWHGIKDRCLNTNGKDYVKYGLAGICVYEGWVNDFMAFFNHIGPAPSKRHQIDRIDSKQGYIPGNVRWVTPTQQQQNKKSCYVWHIKGITYQSAQEAANVHKVTIQTICRWVLGFHDARRNSYTPPRKDCWRQKRYE